MLALEYMFGEGAFMIFVSGVHAVGKTYFCNIVKERLGIKIYSSSQLIAERRK